MNNEFEATVFDRPRTERQCGFNENGDPLQELTRMFEMLCRLYSEGQTDLGPLISDTWTRITDLVETRETRIMVRNKRDK